MQAVLLAAGQSSRFYPLRDFPHKSAVPLVGKPIFLHTLESVRKAGITDVVVITGKDNFIEKEVGDGSAIGLRIVYVVQPEPKGMGDALLQAKDVLHNTFFLLHAHHVQFHEIAGHMHDMGSGGEVVLLAREEEHVERFGVLQLKNEKVVGIVEKPQVGKEPSSLRVIGVYLLNDKFVDFLKKEPVGHYNFESALSTFAKHESVRYVATEEKIVSLKYPWDLFAMNAYLLHAADAAIADTANISKNAILTGKVVVDESAVVMEGAVLKGPCYIGKGATIGTNAIIRDNASIGEKTLVGAFMEVKNAIILSSSKTHSGFIGDSVIGSHNKIAALFSTANVRLDRKNIRVDAVRGEADSGLRDLGVIMGSHNTIGMRVSTMPGVVVGNNVVVGPSTTVLKNIPDNTTYYTKFREVISVHNGQKVSDEAMMNNKKLVLFDIDYTLFDTGVFKESQLTTYNLYTEVLDLLAALRGKARLGIFSEGELDFQKTKLLKTDILKHFLEENIHIVANKDATMREVLKRYKDETVFLVDDKLPVLHAAKEIMGTVKTIWIRRGIYAENQKPIFGFTPDYQVTNLSDVATIVEENF